MRRRTDGECDNGWVVVRSLSLARGRSVAVDSRATATAETASATGRTVLSAVGPAAEGAEHGGRALLLGGRLGVSIEQTKSATDGRTDDERPIVDSWIHTGWGRWSRTWVWLT